MKPSSISQQTTSSSVLLSLTSNWAEFSSSGAGEPYPPTLVFDAPLIWDTPSRMTFSRVALLSRVEMIMPV